MSDQSPQIAPGIIWRVLDDNVVVVSPTGGKVRVLNQLGTVIWQLLTEGKTREDILTHLVDFYEVSAEQAFEDLNGFLIELKERGLVVW